MKTILSATVGMLLCTSAAYAVDYNKLPTRVDHYPMQEWKYCHGKKALMSECVVDGDTIRIGYKSYRVTDLDTAETRQKNCTDPVANQAAKAKGLQAKEATREILSGGEIDVTVYIDPLTKDPATDKYGRVLGTFVAAGVPLGPTLIAQGLGHHYDGGKKTSWCPVTLVPGVTMVPGVGGPVDYNNAQPMPLPSPSAVIGGVVVPVK